MMNQETYVKVHELRKQGWTLEEIAAETGFHPATIAQQLKADGPPSKRQVPDTALVMSAFWKERIATLIGAYPPLLGISVHNKLVSEHFAGGYSTVTRELREIFSSMRSSSSWSVKGLRTRSSAEKSARLAASPA